MPNINPHTNTVINPTFAYRGTVNDDGPVRHVILGTNPQGPESTDTEVGFKQYGEGHLYSAAIVGGPGTGKTTVAQGIATTLTDQGHTRVWTANGHGAPSLGLQSVADRTAQDINDTTAMLRDAVAILTARREAPEKPIRSNGKSVFNLFRLSEGDAAPSPTIVPSNRVPGLVIVLDAAEPLLANDAIRDSVTTIAEDGGPYGVAVITTTTAAHWDAFGGARTHRALTCHSTIVLGQFTQHLSTLLECPLPNLDADGFVADARHHTTTPFTFDRIPAAMSGSDIG